MVVRKKKSSDPDVIGVTPLDTGPANERELFCYAAVQERYINANRTNLSNTIFSLPYPGYDLSGLPEVVGADVLNLHWVAYYQSPFTIKSLLLLGKPVVWTLHDQWAFTGGCHYSAGCENYMLDCSNCPQLASDPFSLPAGVLKDKMELFAGLTLTVVSPSRWLAECVRKSALFGRSRVEVIANGLETDVFRPMSKMRAKRLLGLSPDTMTVLFGAEFGSEKRKGFKELADSIGHCFSDPWFEARVREDKVRILCFGQPDERIDSLKVPVISLGYLQTDQKVREAYNAADIFIQSSMEDNLPNTVLEAMSCGTPVIGFNVGGIPDMVQDGLEGRIVPAGDAAGMANAIVGLLSNPNMRSEMGKRSRARAERFFSLANQARNYGALYGRLTGEGPAPGKPRSQNKAKAGSESARGAETPGPSVPLIIQSGPCFSSVFDSILLMTLKDLSPKLQRDLEELNADRALRLDLINRQGKEIGRLQAETAKWLKECELLWERVNRGEGERNRLEAELEEVKGRLEASEADREERLQVIWRQGEEIAKLQADLHHWLKQCEELWNRINVLQNEKTLTESELLKVEKANEELDQRIRAIKESLGFRLMNRLGMIGDVNNEGK
jgi:glycosyltransferase involved in cell wall biosynthesis